MYLTARLSPYEWRNAHPCKRSHEELENQFSLYNSLWFLTGNIMQQGQLILSKIPLEICPLNRNGFESNGTIDTNDQLFMVIFYVDYCLIVYS